MGAEVVGRREMEWEREGEREGSERNESWLVWRCLLPTGGVGGGCSWRREGGDDTLQEPVLTEGLTDIIKKKSDAILDLIGNKFNVGEICARAHGSVW